MITMQEMKLFLQQRGATFEEEIARHFQTTPQVVAMMAERLEKKGILSAVMVGGGCKKACGCCETPRRAWRFEHG